VKNGTKDRLTKRERIYMCFVRACTCIMSAYIYIYIYTSVNTGHRTELPLGNQKLLSY